MLSGLDDVRLGWCGLDYNIAVNTFSRRVSEVLERPDDFQSTFQTFLCGGEQVEPASVGVITQPL